MNAAQIWSTLPAATLARTCFFHHGTYTVIHPDEGKVLRMMGAVAGGEMLPSWLSRELAPALGTVRAQPISLSGSATEAVYYQGAPQALLTPTTLSSVLSSPTNGLGTADLVKLRDQGLDALLAFARSQGQTAQKNFIDRYATSTAQLRTLQDRLLASLATIKNNSADSQIQAAIILFQMKVTPVVVVNVGFGGDNHGDPGLAGEIAGHGSGVATLAKMTQALATAGHGRPGHLRDDQRLRPHDDRVAVGQRAPAQPGAPRDADDRFARARQRRRRRRRSRRPARSTPRWRSIRRPAAASASGDVAFSATFGAMGKTLGAAVGLPQDNVDTNVLAGAVIKSALAT